MRSIALLLVVASCGTTKLAAQHQDGRGRVTHATEVQSGSLPAWFTSPGETAAAGYETSRAKALVGACAADPNSEACVVGMANDPRAAAYLLRRRYSSRPFGGSARGMGPTGASYDVAAVEAEYRSVFASLSLAPDIVRPRPVRSTSTPTEEPVAPSSRGSGGGSGAGTSRSGESGITFRREEAGPRQPGAPTLAVAPQSGRCSAYSDIQSQFRVAWQEVERVLQIGNVAAARGAFERASRILHDGITSCAADKAAVGALRRAQTELNKLGKEAGLIEGA